MLGHHKDKKIQTSPPTLPAASQVLFFHEMGQEGRAALGVLMGAPGAVGVLIQNFTREREMGGRRKWRVGERDERGRKREQRRGKDGGGGGGDGRHRERNAIPPGFPNQPKHPTLVRWVPRKTPGSAAQRLFPGGTHAFWERVHPPPPPPPRPYLGGSVRVGQ